MPPDSPQHPNPTAPPPPGPTPHLPAAETDALLAHVAKVTTSAVLLTDPEGLVIWANQAFEHITGFTQAEILGKRPGDILQGKDTDPATILAIRKGLKNKTPISVEILNYRKNGEPFWIRLNIDPRFAPDGTLLGYTGINQEITQQKYQEETDRQRHALQQRLETAERYRKMARQLPGMLYQLQLFPDGSHRMPFASPNITDFFGVSPEQAAKDSSAISKALHPDDLDRTWAELLESRDHLTPLKQEYRLLSPDGTTRWISDTATPERLPDGSTLWHGFLWDNTLEKTTQQEITNQRQILWLLSEAASNFIHLPLEEVAPAIQNSLAEISSHLGVDRSYVFRHDYEKQITCNTFEWCAPGIEPQIHNLQETPLEAFPEWLETHIAGEDVYFPDVAAMPESTMRDILLAQDIKSIITVPMTGATGCIGFVGFDAVRHHRSYSQEELNLLHLFARMLVSIQDRLAAHQHAKLAHQQIDSFFEVAIDFHCIANFDGLFIQASKAWETFLGIPRREIARLPFYDFIHPDDLQDTQNRMAALARGEPVVGFVNRYRNANGEYRFLEWHAKAVDKLIFTSARDVTEARLTQTAMEEAFEAQRHAAEMKSNLISMASHEFRTPLASLRLAGELLEQMVPEDPPGPITSLVSTIVKTTDYLTEVVSDVLDFSSIGRASNDAGPTHVELSPWLDEIIQTYRETHGTRNPLSLCLPHHPLPTILTDPALLRRSLANLLENASKYSPAGNPVTLSATLHNDHLTLTVQDQGIGIPADAEHHLFEPFYRAANARTVRGTGLGLAICREAVERLHGSLSYRPGQPNGSIFEIQIPLHPPTPADSPSP